MNESCSQRATPPAGQTKHQVPIALSRKCDVVRRACQPDFAVEQVLSLLGLTAVPACEAWTARRCPTQNGAHPQQEGEAGVAVGDVLDPPPLEVHQAHDDLAQHGETDVDPGRLPQPLPRRPALPLALAPWGRGSRPPSD